MASGLLSLSSNTIVGIDAQATLAPEFLEGARFRKGQTIQIVFMDKNGTAIEDEFLNIKNSITLNYEVKKINGDSQYVIEITREENPTEILECLPCSNAKTMLTNIAQELYSNTRLASGKLDALYSKLDNFDNFSDLSSYAASLQRGLSPHSTTRVARFISSQIDASQKSISEFLSNYGKENKQSFWVSPIYESGRYNAFDCDYLSADSEFEGLVIGTGGKTDIGNIAISLNYIRGELKETGYKNKSTSLGIMLANKINILNNNWLELVGGFSNHQFDQKRFDSLDSWQNSKPDGKSYRFGIALGKDINLNSLKIVPLIGLNYTNFDLDDYKESNANEIGLSVASNGYESLKLKIGTIVETTPYKDLSINAKAYYLVELKDRQYNFNSRFMNIPTINFDTYGEKLNRSAAELGLGAKYNFSEDTAISFDYDINIQDKYVGHGVSANLVINF